MLKRKSYVSRFSQPFSHDELDALAADAAARNLGRGITGMLMFSGGIFYQVLEGPELAVNELFHKISLDPRHKDVLVLTVQEDVESRQFPSWAMKKVSLDEGAMARLDPIKALLEAIVVQLESTKRMTGVLTRSIWQELMVDTQPES